MIGSYISKNLGIPKSVLCMNIKQNCVHPWKGKQIPIIYLNVNKF
jgi:hypothetical protein